MIPSHEKCLLCGCNNPLSMGLKFTKSQGTEVLTTFQSNCYLQGYEGIMHGGVISALLDAIMTNCLYLNSIEAVTGELDVRFLHSVPCQAKLDLSAKIDKSFPPLYWVSAKLFCFNQLMAEAKAKFMQKN